MSGNANDDENDPISSPDDDFPKVMVGAKYLHRFDAHETSQMIRTPWLNEFHSQELVTNLWTRWDGVQGTAESHLQWMHSEARSLLEETNNWRPYGSKNGINYFIHDEKTASCNGYGCFKIQGTLQSIQPRDVVASMVDFSQSNDPTVVLLKALQSPSNKSTKTSKNNNKKNQPEDYFATPVYWCNDPGFPFWYRDGLDISGYKRDVDGTIWQLAVSARGPHFDSMPGALAATDRYWAFRLKEHDGTTDFCLLCQTELNGWIPKTLSNYFLCSVLIDSFAKMQESVRANKATGKHQRLLKYLGIEDL